jgi:hypothetical protein
MARFELRQSTKIYADLREVVRPNVTLWPRRAARQSITTAQDSEDDQILGARMRRIRIADAGSKSKNQKFRKCRFNADVPPIWAN